MVEEGRVGEGGRGEKGGVGWQKREERMKDSKIRNSELCLASSHVL